MKVFLVQSYRLAKFSIKNRYRNTWIGFAWVLLQPTIQFGIQAYAFKHVVRIEQADYYSFLVTGLLPWIFIASSLEMSVGTFQNFSFLFKSIVVNPLAFVCAQVLDNLILLVVCLVVAIGALSTIESVSFLKALGFIPACIPLFIATTAVASIAATYQVFFRDLRYVLTFGIQSLYFLTPVLYPPEFIPEAHRWLAQFNPIYLLIKPFRYAVFEDFSIYLESLAVSSAIAVASVLIGIVVWRRNANEAILNA